MKNKSGFTLVELIVVIAILGLLTIIAVFNYLNVQRDARDKQRASDAAVVADGLEKYFAKNGEYPSVAQVTNSNGNTVKQLLGLAGVDALVAPFAPSGTTNSWATGYNVTPSKSNTVTYAGNTDNSTSCNTGTAATDACLDFKIQYYNEQDGTVVTIYSRNKSVAVNVTAREGIVAPDVPAVTASISGSNAVGTVAAVPCAVGATTQYAFQNRSNGGAWSAWTAWGTTTTNTVAANQGAQYGFHAKARCVVGSDSSSESAVSAEDTKVRPITVPAAPNVYSTSPFRPNYDGGLCMDAKSGGTAPGTLIQVYTCNGSAAQDWARDSGAGTFTRSDTLTSCIQYMGKGVQLQLQTCNGSTSQQWTSNANGSYTNVASGYCMDASNWGPSGTQIGSWDCTGATAQIWNPADSQTAWTWPGSPCPAGTSVEYQAYNQTTSLADSGWYSTGTTPRVVRTTSSQGYTYITQARTRCYTTYYDTGWGAAGSSGIVKAVLVPDAPYNFSFFINGANRYNMNWGWNFTLSCGAGTSAYYIEDEWLGGAGNPVYWLSPRSPNGVGVVGWWTADSTNGNSPGYIVSGPGGVQQTTASYAGAAPAPSGIPVAGRAQGYCKNLTTGRTSAYGAWGTGNGSL